MLTEEKFCELIKTNQGFEVALGFRDDVDHYIGGTCDKIWYLIQKGTNQDYYMATRVDGVWQDTHYTYKRKKLSSEPAESGRTMEMILDRLAIGQAEIESDGRKPIQKVVYELPCSHYSFAFGERAYAIVNDYGVTVEYSNIKDEEAGFRLRTLKTGDEVNAPKEA